MKPLLIGLTGRARSGKSTAAEHLVGTTCWSTTRSLIRSAMA